MIKWYGLLNKVTACTWYVHITVKCSFSVQQEQSQRLWITLIIVCAALYCTNYLIEALNIFDTNKVTCTPLANQLYMYLSVIAEKRNWCQFLVFISILD